MYFYSPEDRESKELFNGITTRTFWGDKMLISLVDVPAGAVVPPHSHPHEQTGILLEGELTFHTAESSHVTGPGSVVFAPRGQQHTFRNTGRTRARMLILTTPGGIED